MRLAVVEMQQNDLPWPLLIAAQAFVNLY